MDYFCVTEFWSGREGEGFLAWAHVCVAALSWKWDLDANVESRNRSACLENVGLALMDSTVWKNCSPPPNHTHSVWKLLQLSHSYLSTCLQFYSASSSLHQKDKMSSNDVRLDEFLKQILRLVHKVLEIYIAQLLLKMMQQIQIHISREIISMMIACLIVIDCIS